MKFPGVLLLLTLPIIIYLTSFGFFVYDTSFYTALTDKYSIVPEQARLMNPDMLDYFKTGNVPASFSGFSEKELSHLADVQTVIYCLILFLILLIALFAGRINHAEERQKIFFYGGIITMIIPLLFLLLPFDFLFTQMHNIFFAEGTWIFEGTDLIINLYPFDFFLAFAQQIFLAGFCLGAGITFFTWFLNRKN